MADLPTRALSLIQPWAWCVIHGPKDIENRTWWTEVRGPTWIAASAQVTRQYYDQAKAVIEWSEPGIRVPGLDELDYGCISGRATITDCILPGGYQLPAGGSGTIVQRAAHRARMRATSFELDAPRHPLHPHRWHFPEQFGYVLADRTALETPVPCKGHQKWWTVPPALLEQLKVAALGPPTQLQRA